jgi:Tfp pilus assembly protein PilF
MYKEDYKNAEENFRESISLNSKYLNSYINLAHIYVKRDDDKKAYRIIKAALGCSDDSRLYNIEKELLKKISESI